MFRKLTLAAAAVAALGAAALVPTAASASPNFSIHLGGFGPGYGYGPYYGGYYNYGPDCFLKKVKVWSNKKHKFVWKTKQICY